MKKQLLFVFLAIMAFKVWHSVTLVWVFLFLAVMTFISRKRNPEKELSARIEEDAKNHHCHIPRNKLVRRKLVLIYAKYLRTTKKFPEMRQTYSELMDSLWEKLSSTYSLSVWRETLEDLLSSWPTPEPITVSSYEESLERTKKLSASWRESRNEAFGN
ncbi:MAG: hypothetical protein HOE90_00765 [Bacteriovoracaceae bacterium]|jgi:hypothetical protein|nr:hypothetical protein [Bacteriovoracaceae bacterium]